MATFVLVHGSYQGGWIWKPVATRLRAAGHEVYAPTLDGCAERASQVRAGIDTESQADEVAQLLFYEDLHDVVLVGTSSGGMVVCRVAELIPERIGRLVFVDALALFSGEKIRDIVTRSTAAAGGLTAGPSREDAANRLFAEGGVAQTTVRDIAEAAGVTERTLFRYFSSKEELLLEQAFAWVPAFQQLILARPPEEPPLVAVQQALRTAMAFITQSSALASTST